MKRFRQYGGVFVRGALMGAADVVPGVSGGTVAFITGIYFRLLGAIAAIPTAVLHELLRGRIRRFWNRIDGTFLVVLLSGILTSIAAFANLITWAIETYPVAMWSFFFGLILASVWHVLGQLNMPRAWHLVPLVAGTGIAWWITTLTAGQVEPNAWVFFWSGAIAICAMILPGLSGSFVLLVLGMYAPVLAAVGDFDVFTMLIFASGCAVGLLSFARLLGWILRKAHDGVLALLTGFMIGALNRVWPWQEVLAWRTDSSGARVPMEQVSISPMRYAEITGDSAQVLVAVVALALGIAVVLGGEWLAHRRSGNDMAAPVNV